MSSPRSTVKPTTNRNEFVELPERGVTLAAEWVLANEPVGSVLLVPGYTGSKEDFSTLLPLIAEQGFSAYSYDQRGQFETTSDGEFSLASWADDASAFASTLPGQAAGQPVHLVGHSLGGLVVTEAAIRHRQDWATVTLLCSGPGGHGDAPRLQLMIDALAQLDIDDVYDRKRAIELADGAALNAPDVEEFLRRRFVAGNPASLSAMSQVLIDTPDRIADLVETGIPAFVVYGERDAAWPQEVQDEMAVRLGTTSVVIPDADHSPNVEQPQATADVMVRLFTS